MKRLICTSLLLLMNMSYAQEQVPKLSDEELTPFCENQMLWEPFKVKPEQCMEVAKPCSDRISESGTTDLGLATQQLYACVFDGLGIEMPTE